MAMDVRDILTSVTFDFYGANSIEESKYEDAFLCAFELVANIVGGIAGECNTARVICRKKIVNLCDANEQDEDKKIVYTLNWHSILGHVRSIAEAIYLSDNNEVSIVLDTSPSLRILVVVDPVYFRLEFLRSRVVATPARTKAESSQIPGVGPISRAIRRWLGRADQGSAIPRDGS